MRSGNMKIQSEKNWITVIHNELPVIKVTKDLQLLVDFLGGLSSDHDFTVQKKTKKKKKKISKAKEDKMTRAIQLEKAYRKYRKEFYKFGKVNTTKPHHDAFKHFVSAVEIMERTDVKIKTFIKAQVEGLKFANNGQGVYPKVNQLSTDAAEQRVLDYLRSKNVTVELTEQEKSLELSQNKKYKTLHRKVKNGTATLLEAVYVKECQLARRDMVQSMVEEYINGLKKK